MTRIEPEPWRIMLDHARRDYPEECCGAMLGRWVNGIRCVLRAVPLENAHSGPRQARYQVRPEDLLRVEREACSQGLELLGIYHSHTDSPAYFSQTDLENSCPWYCYVVLSICQGRFAGAGCWVPDADQTSAIQESFHYPESLTGESLCQQS